MRLNGKRNLIAGFLLIAVFILWTWAVMTVDVKPCGVEGTDIGFSQINICFHSLTGVNMMLYNITDWLGLVPVFVCMLFGFCGFFQLIKRKSLFKVDRDIIISGFYYVTVIVCYLIFEMIPVNFRPVLINGISEASYPSSTTLLVLSVMPSLSFLSGRRLKRKESRKFITVLCAVFCAFMLAGRIFSGVHWITDIIGGALLSFGLFFIYKGTVFLAEKNKTEC